MSEVEKVHLLESKQHRRARLGSKMCGEYALCGNGSYHAKTTTVRKLVTCSVCLEALQKYPYAAR